MKAGVLIVGFVVLISLGTYLLVRQGETDPYISPKAAPIESSKEEAPPQPTEHQGASIGDENLVEFVCAEGKTLTAVFARDILGLTLSDGRQISLRQADVASGVRYLNNTQTIEFRGKEDGAVLAEGGVTTYTNCMAEQ